MAQTRRGAAEPEPSRAERNAYSDARAGLRNRRFLRPDGALGEYRFFGFTAKQQRCGDRRDARRAAASTLAGVAVAVGTAALLAFLIPSKVPTSEILARATPNLLDLMVALVSGAAGAYATCRKELASSLPGVAIAVALVPSLCVVGYGLGAGHINIAKGAGLLFATNLASIVLAGIAVFWLLGFRPLNEKDLPSFRRSLRWSILGVVLLMVPLGYVSFLQIREANTQAAVEQILTDGLDPAKLELENITTDPSEGGYIVGFTAYVYGKTDGAANVA